MKVLATLRRALTGRPRRQLLDPRRENETAKFTFGDHKWFATVGRFSNGDLGEIFLSTAKSGELLRNMANDAAIAASLALQFGCPAETLRDALSRDSRDAPASPLCAALDLLTREELEP